MAHRIVCKVASQTHTFKKTDTQHQDECNALDDREN